MKKKVLTTIFASAALLATSVGMVGCGGGDGGNSSSTSGSQDGANKVTINFWHTFGKTPADSIELKAKDFASIIKQKEGVDVEFKFTYKGSYDDLLSNITKSFASGTNPTLAVAYPDHVADYFGAERTPGEYIVKLDDYMNDPVIGFGKESYLGDNYGADDFVEAFLKEGQQYSREGTYSLPYMKSSEVMFYNKNAVRTFMPYYDASIETDEDITNFMENLTWDEFMEFCEVIKDTNDAEQLYPTLETPAFYDSDGNFVISKIYQEEIPFASIDSAGHGRIDFNGYEVEGYTPEADQIENYDRIVDLLDGFKDLYNKGIFTTKGAYGEYGSNSFKQQKSVFSIGSSGGAGYNFPSTSTFDVGICMVPASNDNPLYVSQGVSLTMFNNGSMSEEENSKTLKYAWKFLKYITNEEVNSELCINGSEGYIPVRESAYNTTKFLTFMRDGENYAKTADTVIHGIDGRFLNTPVFKGSAALRDNMGGALADVLLLGKKQDGSYSPYTKDQIKEILNRAISNTIQKM